MKEEKQHGQLIFSIIVPVYNQWNIINNLIDSLRCQSISSSVFELILIDNGSESFAKQPVWEGKGATLQCLTPGAYAARNHGARHAQGSWLVFTDADCIPDVCWLEQMLNAVSTSESQDVFYAGDIQMLTESTRPNSYEIYDLVKGIPQSHYARRGYAATANLAVPKEMFEQNGGFDEKRFSGGDAELCRRLVAAGNSLVFCPSAVVFHPARQTWLEVSTKARRLKGGQILGGSPSRRAYWLFRTLCPPVVAWWRFLRATRQPLKYRLIASWVQLKLWFVEIAEVIQLLAGGMAERR